MFFSSSFFKFLLTSPKNQTGVHSQTIDGEDISSSSFSSDLPDHPSSSPTTSHSGENIIVYYGDSSGSMWILYFRFLCLNKKLTIENDKTAKPTNESEEEKKNYKNSILLTTYIYKARILINCYSSISSYSDFFFLYIVFGYLRTHRQVKKKRQAGKTKSRWFQSFEIMDG